MRDRIRVTFLANAAVLLEFRGIKLLIDGIYDKKGHCFSNLSARQWEDLRSGEGIFSDIGYLLFTHEHGDHFSPERVMEYLQYQHPRAIFMPEKGSQALNELKEYVKEKRLPCALLERKLCEKTVFMPERDIRIKIFRTRHLDQVYWEVPHFCYLLELGRKKLLFTGDADFTEENICFTEQGPLDAVFINPLWENSKEGKKLLMQEPMRRGIKFIYHIPFPEDDFMGIRKTAEREKYTSWKKEEKKIFFMERGQIYDL